MVRSMNPQWKEADGAFDATRVGFAPARAAIDNASGLPRVLYEEAPGAYIRRVLWEVDDAIESLTWLRRVLVDEALDKRWLSQRDLADAAGLSVATLQRWRDDPLPLTHTPEADVFGPDVPLEKRGREVGGRVSPEGG